MGGEQARAHLYIAREGRPRLAEDDRRPPPRHRHRRTGPDRLGHRHVHEREEPEAEERGTGRQPQIQTRHPGRTVHRPRHGTPHHAGRPADARPGDRRRAETQPRRRADARHGIGGTRLEDRRGILAPDRTHAGPVRRIPARRRVQAGRRNEMGAPPRRPDRRTGQGPVDQPPTPPGRQTAHPGTRRHTGSNAIHGRDTGPAGRRASRAGSRQDVHPHERETGQDDGTGTSHRHDRIAIPGRRPGNGIRNAGTGAP